MRNETRCFFAGAAAAVNGGDGGSGEPARSPPVRGGAGRLRPYGDVRASFEPWRRVALLAWAAREEAATVN